MVKIQGMHPSDELFLQLWRYSDQQSSFEVKLLLLQRGIAIIFFQLPCIFKYLCIFCKNIQKYFMVLNQIIASIFTYTKYQPYHFVKSNIEFHLRMKEIPRLTFTKNVHSLGIHYHHIICVIFPL